MKYSLEQLEAFVTTVETGSFSAASRKLGKAQSSISGLIANMEIDMGFELFDRKSRSPKLTTEGRILLKEIKAVLYSHSNLVKKAESVVDKIDNEISLGFDELAFPRHAFTEILRSFKAKFPTTSILVVNCSHNEGYRLVQKQRVDLAITLSKEEYPQGMAFKGVSQVNYSTVVCDDHPLANMTTVSPLDLSLHQHIRITDSRAGFRTHDSDLTTNIWYTDNCPMMLELVLNGFGWAELPKHIFSAQPRLRKLTTTHQSVSYVQNVDLIWRNEIALGAAGKWLVNQFSEVGAKMTIR